MIFGLKLISVLLVVCLGNMLLVSMLDSLGYLTVFAICCILIEALLLVGIFIVRWVILPINDLYESLQAIDFEKDIIDFSKLDSLEARGIKEIRVITTKFKYLLDVITERINKVNNETYKSEHDALTGCYNRVRLENIKGTYEYSQLIGIIFIDVNNLKRMNDEFGHDAGDALLKSASVKLNFWNNYGDVYRMGGDEFMIVIRDKRQEYIESLIKKWYPTVGQLNRNSDGFKCVLSYGTAYGSRGCDFDALQKQADDNMYEMKVALKKKFGEPMR